MIDIITTIGTTVGVANEVVSATMGAIAISLLLLGGSWVTKKFKQGNKRYGRSL